MSFFEHKYYRTYIKIWDRLHVKHTTKNMRLYIAYYLKCVRLAQRDYKDIGYNKSLGRYEWYKSLSKIAEVTNA
jgi:hypothetical protein